MRTALCYAVAAAVAGLIVAGSGGAAIADVRAGVEAWSRGEYRKAVDEWRPAANAGDADAQFNIGQAYSVGLGVPVDIAMAEKWFRKAALQGHVEAQAKYGIVLFDEGKRGEAVPWLEKAVARGEPRAQLVLGTMLYNGDGVEKNWPRAYALLVRSAAAGTPRASEVQAQMDRYIPTDQRQQGLVLARQYEAEAQRPELPFEIAGPGSVQGMRGADLPPSKYDPNGGEQPGLPVPVATRKTHIVVRSPSDPLPLAPPVVRAVAAGGGWRVQLGAFGDPGNARRLWAQLGGQFAGASVSYVKSGSLTRVLVGPYGSKGAAAAACGSIRPCVPVAP